MAYIIATLSSSSRQMKAVVAQWLLQCNEITPSSSDVRPVTS